MQWRCARTIRELALQSEESRAVCYGERIEATIIQALVSTTTTELYCNACTD